MAIINFFVVYGNLFHFEEPKKGSKFWSAVVLQNGALIYGNHFLGFYCFQWPIETLHSCNLFGPMSLTNLKVVKRTHWLILLLIASQFNFLNSFCDNMSHLIKIEAKSNSFILSTLNFVFQFSVKIRIPCSARIIKMQLNQYLHKKTLLRHRVQKCFFLNK